MGRKWRRHWRHLLEVHRRGGRADLLRGVSQATDERLPASLAPGASERHRLQQERRRVDRIRRSRRSRGQVRVRQERGTQWRHVLVVHSFIYSF